MDDEIISTLQRKPVSDIEKIKLTFLASTGVKIIKSNESFDPREYDYLSNILSCYYFHAASLLKDFMEKENDANEILEKTSEIIRELYPFCKQELLEILTILILRDNCLTDKECLILFEIAEKNLGMSDSEIIDIVLKTIKRYFKPGY